MHTQKESHVRNGEHFIVLKHGVSTPPEMPWNDNACIAYQYGVPGISPGSLAEPRGPVRGCAPTRLRSISTCRVCTGQAKMIPRAVTSLVSPLGERYRFRIPGGSSIWTILVWTCFLSWRVAQHFPVLIPGTPVLWDSYMPDHWGASFDYLIIIRDWPCNRVLGFYRWHTFDIRSE